jgi:hypothetical protein
MPGRWDMLTEIFKPFIEKRPASVMARAALERLLSPKWIDEVFEATTDGQYTRSLLFSSVFALMVRVVFKQAKSVRRAYLPNADEVAVSLTSVYNKLNGISPATSARLVREAGRACAQAIEQMGGAKAPWLEGYRVRILDGNCLAGTEHRIGELRSLRAGALPGKALVVYAHEWGCVTDAVPCEDGHAQERALIHAVLPIVQPGELWIEDRNFCTRGFLFGVVRDRGAHVLVREHNNLPVLECEPERAVGSTDTGWVAEQDVTVESHHRDDSLRLRRVIVRLKAPTRDGDRVLRLLTDLPSSIEATTIAALYRRRWTIETAFQELERDLHSEIETLGYPRAALFGFCVAMVAYNIMALVYGALRAKHGAEKIEEQFSHYCLADELQMTYDGMMVAIPEDHWQVFGRMTDREFADALLSLATQVNLSLFRKSRRGPKKPRPISKVDPNTPHVSTARLVADRKRKRN